MVWKNWYLYFALFVVVVAAYMNSFNAPFIFDDEHTIVTNGGIRDITNLKAVLFNSENAGRPLLFVTFALNYAVGELKPFGYHVVNFILHFGTSCLVFLLLAEILGREGVADRLWPAFGAALFALHPMGVEAVTYIASRSDGLSTFLYLLAFYMLIRGGLRFGWRFALAMAAFVLALLTKETAITLPALAVVFALAYGGGIRRENAWPLAMLWAVLPLYFLFRSFALGYALEKYVAKDVSVHDYFLSQLVVVPFQYIPRLFVPIYQILDADQTVVDASLIPSVLAGGAMALALLVFAFLRFRVSRPYSFSILWFFGALSVTSSFYPIFDAYAERRLYLALPAFCLAVVYSLHLLEKRLACPRKKIVAVAVAVLAVFGGLTWERNRLFAHPVLIMEDNISKTFTNPRMHVAVFHEYLRAGQGDKAEETILFAVKAFPESAFVRLDYCWLLGSKGEFEKLERELVGIKPIRPNEFAWYYDFKGVIAGQKGDFDAAMGYFRKAIAADPKHGRGNIVVLLKMMGRDKDAQEYARRTLKEFPLDADMHFQLGLLLSKDDAGAAMEEFRTALRLSPGHSGALKMVEKFGNISG